jgi:hypothetical protein
MLQCRPFGKPVLVVLAGLVLSLAGRASAAEGAHRALRAALYHLKEARVEVRDEKFKLHRERVERDISTAIREVERALKEGRIEARYEPNKGWGDKHKSFRHLRQALIELDEAKADIRAEKGDWARRRELREAIDDARNRVADALREIK